MALRLATKINRHIIQTFSRRPLSVGPPATEVQVERSQSAEDHEGALLAIAAGEKSGPKAYQVCKPRASSVDRTLSMGKLADNESEMVKESSKKQHLQPSHLPEYYRSQNDFSNATCRTVEDTMDPKTGSTYKEFSASKTFTSVTLPLKGVKLAKPFPDPVKMMASHTVSDQEKAQQMFSESRTPMRVTEKRQLPQVAVNQPHRKYSSTKCPGKEGPGASVSKCKKVTMDNCEPTASICCKPNYNYKPCEKKEAPYPSFSETCYEEFYEKPSECKLCPWRPEDNPHFKPSKKHYHTNIVLQAFKKRDCPPPPKPKEPCGWVAEEKERELQKTAPRQQPKKTTTTKAAMPAEAAQYLDVDDLHQRNDLQMFLELAPPPKKVPCEQPEGECEKRKKIQKEKELAKEKPKKTCTSRLDSAMSHWLSFLQPSRQFLQPGFVSQWSPSQTNLLASSTEAEGPCKKFPFKEIPYEFIKEHPVRPKNGTPCKKKVRKSIIDCPGSPEEETCDKKAQMRYLEMDKGVGMLLKEEGRTGKDPKKCPKVDLGECYGEPDSGEGVEDECGKKPMKSRICPTDLIPVKGRKKPTPKTASAIIPPPKHAEAGRRVQQQQLRRKSTALSRFYR